jgi:DNA-binding MarR family transcriptional regulator
MSEFTGIWMAASVLAIKELTPTEKVVLCAVIPLALNEPCTARNRHFAEQLAISETSISLNLKSLDDKGYICIDPGTERGNKREIHLYRSGDTLFKIVKEPSLTSLNTLFNFLKEPLKHSSRAFLTSLKSLFKHLKEPYIRIESIIESIEESKKEIDDDDHENARVTDNNLLPVDAEKKDPQTPSSAAPLSPELPPPKPLKRKFGDGELQELVREHVRGHPEENLPVEMIIKFLEHWTGIVQNDEKESNNGKEDWRTQRKWDTSTRLAKWHLNYLKDQKRDESAVAQTNPVNGVRSRQTGGEQTTNSRPTRRTPVITADKLRRESASARNPGEGSDGRTIVIDVDGGS